MLRDCFFYEEVKRYMTSLSTAQWSCGAWQSIRTSSLVSSSAVLTAGLILLISWKKKKKKNKKKMQLPQSPDHSLSFIKSKI